MSNDSPSRGPRTAAPAPMGSTVAIVVTAVALVLGFLILRKVNSGPDDAGTTPVVTETPGDTTIDPTQSTIATTTTTPVDLTLTMVQVANASTQSGVAKQLTTALASIGYSTTTATNSTLSTKLMTSKILYNPDDPNAKLIADTLAARLAGIPVEAASGALPVESTTWANGSGVIVMLGNDLAGRTLDQIAGVTVTGTTAPNAISIPPITSPTPGT